MEFKTPSGKIELFSQQAKDHQHSPFGMGLMENRNDPHYPYMLLLNHEPFRINSQFQNLNSFKKINREPCIYLHPLLAKEKDIQRNSMVKVASEKGEIVVRANFSTDLNQQTLVIYPNHPLINKLISFTASDMGEVMTSGKGNALNDLHVDITKLC
ncbi:MAG TPA: molybdopterin dinucleotide binding domain-containing protein [Neobacillus sp.]